MTAVETVWPGPGCVFLGHPRSPRSAVLRGQLHFLLPRSGGHCCQPCLSELMLPTADPSVSPTHQVGHQGLPQGTVSQHWHFPGQLWALGPQTRGWTEGRRCTGIHCGGKDSVTQLQRHGIQGGERAGVAPQRLGGREEGGREWCLTRPRCPWPGTPALLCHHCQKRPRFPLHQTSVWEPQCPRLGVRSGQGQSQPTLRRGGTAPAMPAQVPPRATFTHNGVWMGVCPRSSSTLKKLTSE